MLVQGNPAPNGPAFVLGSPGRAHCFAGLTRRHPQPIPGGTDPLVCAAACNTTRGCRVWAQGPGPHVPGPAVVTRRGDYFDPLLAKTARGAGPCGSRQFTRTTFRSCRLPRATCDTRPHFRRVCSRAVLQEQVRLRATPRAEGGSRAFMLSPGVPGEGLIDLPAALPAAGKRHQNGIASASYAQRFKGCPRPVPVRPGVPRRRPRVRQSRLRRPASSPAEGNGGFPEPRHRQVVHRRGGAHSQHGEEDARHHQPAAGLAPFPPH